MFIGSVADIAIWPAVPGLVSANGRQVLPLSSDQPVFTGAPAPFSQPTNAANCGCRAQYVRDVACATVRKVVIVASGG
jgi:hypothetical protein